MWFAPSSPLHVQVPLELIEWQPVYHQTGATGLSGGQWSANWRVRGRLGGLPVVQGVGVVLGF